MNPFKPDIRSRHSVGEVPDEANDDQTENAATLIKYVEEENRWGDLAVDPTDDSLSGFDPAAFARRIQNGEDF